jgi:hypothetical protein
MGEKQNQHFLAEVLQKWGGTWDSLRSAGADRRPLQALQMKII